MEIRTTFHRKLREIQDDILAMGSMVEKAILRSIDALKNRNIDLAKQVITEDAKVNEKRFEIEEKCIPAECKSSGKMRQFSGKS